jgi:hypothetical protein
MDAHTQTWWAKTFIGAAVMGLASPGCVRRTLTINTEPQGALVWLNGEEVGTAPVTTDFLWYGDYEVVARMPGYQTLSTHHVLKEPWYQLPGVDFFSEILYPGRVVDARTAEFTLEPEALPSTEQLLENAAAFRERALGPAPKTEEKKVDAPPDQSVKPAPLTTQGTPPVELEPPPGEPEVEPARMEMRPVSTPASPRKP